MKLTYLKITFKYIQHLQCNATSAIVSCTTLIMGFDVMLLSGVSDDVRRLCLFA